MVNGLELSILVAYLGVVFAVGIVAHRRVSLDPTEYYLAGRSIGTLVLTFTIMATALSTFAFFGVGGFAAATGLGLFVFLALQALGQPLLLTLVGERLNEVGERLDVHTPMDYLADRYESPAVGVVYIGVCLVFLIPFVAVQIIGGGIALDVLVDIPYEAGVVAITLAMAVYVHFTGMRGVTWTDLLQGVVMFGSMIGLFVYTLVIVGPSELVSATRTADPQLLSFAGPAGIWTPRYVTTFAVGILGFVAIPQIYQRMLGAADRQTLRRSTLLFPLIVVPFYFAAVALAVWAVGHVGMPDNPDYIIPTLTVEVAGPVVGSIVLAAAIAALMSSADSVSLSLSSMVSRDLYGRYLNPDADHEREVRVTQVTLLVVHLLALALAGIEPGLIFELTVIAITAVGTTTPAVFGPLFWRGATSTGAIASMIVGPSILIAVTFGLIPSRFLFGTHESFVALLAAAVVFVGVSLGTTAPSQQTIDRHFGSHADSETGASTTRPEDPAAVAERGDD
jgi:SSS family solute:Na+ symporter